MASQVGDFISQQIGMDVSGSQVGNAGISGMVAEHIGSRISAGLRVGNNEIGYMEEMAKAFSRSVTPSKLATFQQNVPPGRHRSLRTLVRSSSPRRRNEGDTLQARLRRLPQMDHEEEIENERLSMRLNAIESAQRHIAQHMGRQSENQVKIVNAMTGLDATVKLLSDGLHGNVLAPLHKLREVADYQHGRIEVQAKVLEKHDGALLELQAVALEVRAAVLELVARPTQAPPQQQLTRAPDGDFVQREKRVWQTGEWKQGDDGSSRRDFKAYTMATVGMVGVHTVTEGLAAAAAAQADAQHAAAAGLPAAAAAPAQAAAPAPAPPVVEVPPFATYDPWRQSAAQLPARAEVRAEAPPQTTPATPATPV